MATEQSVHHPIQAPHGDVDGSPRPREFNEMASVYLKSQFHGNSCGRIRRAVHGRPTIRRPNRLKERPRLCFQKKGKTTRSGICFTAATRKCCSTLGYSTGQCSKAHSVGINWGTVSQWSTNRSKRCAVQYKRNFSRESSSFNLFEVWFLN